MGYIYGGIAAALLALSVACYIFYQDAAIAERDLKIAKGQLETAVEINRENEKAAKAAAKRAEEDRKATAKAIEDSKVLNEQGSKIKQENRRDPEANTPAGDAWDRFGDRLRNRQIGH